MNSTVRLSFKIVFIEFRTCGFREQYTEPTDKKPNSQSNAAIQTQLEWHFSNLDLILFFSFLIENIG